MTRAMAAGTVMLGMIIFCAPAVARGRDLRSTSSHTTATNARFTPRFGYAARFAEYRRATVHQGSSHYRQTRIFWRARRRTVDPASGRLNPRNFVRLSKSAAPAPRVKAPARRPTRAVRRHRRHR